MRGWSQSTQSGPTDGRHPRAFVARVSGHGALVASAIAAATSTLVGENPPLRREPVGLRCSAVATAVGVIVGRSHNDCRSRRIALTRAGVSNPLTPGRPMSTQKNDCRRRRGEPGVSGFETPARVRAIRRDLPVIMTSPTMTPTAVATALQRSANRFPTKRWIFPNQGPTSRRRSRKPQALHDLTPLATNARGWRRLWTALGRLRPSAHGAIPSDGPAQRRPRPATGQNPCAEDLIPRRKVDFLQKPPPAWMLRIFAAISVTI